MEINYFKMSLYNRFLVFVHVIDCIVVYVYALCVSNSVYLTSRTFLRLRQCWGIGKRGIPTWGRRFQIRFKSRRTFDLDLQDDGLFPLMWLVGWFMNWKIISRWRAQTIDPISWCVFIGVKYLCVTTFWVPHTWLMVRYSHVSHSWHLKVKFKFYILNVVLCNRITTMVAMQPWP